MKKSVSLHPQNTTDGALAQLARASDWQSGGREFDSHTLHIKQALAMIVSACFVIVGFVSVRYCTSRM